MTCSTSQRSRPANFRIAPARTDLHALVRRCADLWAAQAEAAGLTFQLDIDPSFPAVALVDSAPSEPDPVQPAAPTRVKFTAGGEVGLSARAVATGRRPDRSWKFTVSDSGLGIAPEVMRRACSTPSSRPTPRSRASSAAPASVWPSAGRLAALMGGRIAVRSQPGRGSVFELQVEAEVGEGVQAARYR